MDRKTGLYENVEEDGERGLDRGRVFDVERAFGDGRELFRDKSLIGTGDV